MRIFTLCVVLLQYVLASKATGKGTDRQQNERRHLERRATTVFSDDFSSGHLDSSKWSHFIAANGLGNHEFQMYTPEPANSFVKDGILYIKPTLTVDHFGENFLNSGHLDLNAQWGSCSTSDKCDLNGYNQIPPIMSAKVISKGHIRYGRVEVVAKMPKGDWLWPAIWMTPTESHYGHWPRSGEIDILESRGNLHYYWMPQRWTMGAGVDYVNIHYGQEWNHKTNHGDQLTLHGGTFADAFHTFWLDWTKDYLKIGVDNTTIQTLNTPAHGYWQEGGFSGNNIWADGGKDAPFDRPFQLNLNVAVGGNWFRSNYHNEPYPQPWHDDWDNKMMEFWSARHLWEPTWHGDDVAMKVRSVKLIQY